MGLVRDFTSGELDRLQDVQGSAMQDTCVVSVFSSSQDDWGNPAVVYTDGSAIACGVEHVKPDEQQASGDVPVIDAVIRLPIATSLDPADLIRVTYRYGVDTTDEMYEIVGPVRRGPSGLRVNCRRRVGSNAVAGPWWLGPWPGYDVSIQAINAADVLVAYQPKAAAGTIYARDVESYAESLVNLANPGTYNAVDDYAPGWTADDGWISDGSRILYTGRAWGNSQDQTMLLAFDNASTARVYGAGAFVSGPSLVAIIPQLDGDFGFGNCSALALAPGAAENQGVAGFAGTQTYVDGVASISIGAFVANIPVQVGIFCVTDLPGGLGEMDISAFVWYSTVITEQQALAVSWAMRLILEA